MKRVLVLNYEFPPLGGGGGIAAQKLAKGFIQNGYEVDYITTWYKGLKKFEVVDGINVYRVRVLGRKDLQTATMISMLSYPITGLWRGVQLCRKNKYEFINTHFVVPTGPLGYILSKVFNIKNILSIHGGDIYDPTKRGSPHNYSYIRAVVNFLLNKADAVVAQSINTKENCIKYYQPDKDIKVIPLPYEVVQFTKASRGELNLDNNRKYIIGIGRLVKRKGFDFFIKVLASLPNNVSGIIIGDGPEREHLENLAKEAGVADRIIFTGMVDQNKKFQYLQNSNLFFLSSLHEGFGIVLQEAMQVGLPIVSTNNGGQVDFVRDGENGFLVEFNNIGQAVNKIELILSNPDLFSKENFKNPASIWGLKEIAGEYIKLI